MKINCKKPQENHELSINAQPKSHPIMNFQLTIQQSSLHSSSNLHQKDFQTTVVDFNRILKTKNHSRHLDENWIHCYFFNMIEVKIRDKIFDIIF